MNSGRPLVRIAHAYGNSRASLRRALATPIDMIEADIWFRVSEVWVRHERRLGPLPLLADHWGPASHSAGPYAVTVWPGYYIRPDVHPLTLGELLDTAVGQRRLLLDVKGSNEGAENDTFAAAVVQQVSKHGSQKKVVVCGQNWTMLNRLREWAPWLEVRYSIERPWQWEKFLDMATSDDTVHQICMDHQLLNEEKARFLAEKGVDVYCWTVDDPVEAKRLVAAGVDGIISNNLALLGSLGGSPTAVGS